MANIDARLIEVNNSAKMEDPSDPATGHSQIADFYAGKNILITGGSGFIGKVLTEKLLRSCPDIGNVYMFMRAKKGKSPEDRFKEYFEDSIFMRLREEKLGFAEKVTMIEADMAAEDLALAPENRELIRQTNIIFHAAANVKFNETLRQITNINVRGTKLLLDIAREMPNLKAFVYISTAYSFCVREDIDEKLYTPPISADKLLTLLDTLTDEQLIHLTPKLQGEWPNTYALSKAVGEDTIGRFGDGLPICIVRPSIVVSTSKDPFAGWINNMYGAVGIIVGSSMGLLRTLHCDPTKVSDMIPADYVIANIIAAAWDVAQSQNIPLSVRDSSSSVDSTSEKEKVMIYNTVSSCQNPVTWRMFMTYNEKPGLDLPSSSCLWYYMMVIPRNKYELLIATLLLHWLPAVIMDTVAIVIGRKPKLVNMYKKVQTFGDVVSYFALREWRFKNENVLKLWDKMNPADRAIFDFNVANIDWAEFYFNLTKGIRMFVLNDPLDTLPEARKRYKKLKIAHYTTLTTISLLFAWLCLRLLFYMWSLVF